MQRKKFGVIWGSQRIEEFMKRFLLSNFNVKLHQPLWNNYFSTLNIDSHLKGSHYLSLQDWSRIKVWISSVRGHDAVASKGRN
jgi:hypothetical protein